MADPLIVPVPDELTEPFWTAARDQRLSLQRCANCRKINHPPQTACGWCSSVELNFEDVDGHGRIATYTSQLVRSRALDQSEYTNVVVELDEQDGVLLVGRVPGPRPGWVCIGQPVEPWFEAMDGTDVVLPQFRPTGRED